MPWSVLALGLVGCAGTSSVDSLDTTPGADSVGSETGLPPDYEKRTEAILALDGSSVEGERVYRVWCLACHAATGKGSKSGPSLVERLPKTDEASVIRLILEGEGDMTSYARLLDNQEIADVTAYLWTAFASQ